MANSPTDIGNLALDLLAGGTVVNIETPTDATESLLNRWYHKSRKKVLREHPWNFAAKRASIAASATAPAFGYSYQYPVPSDFIRLLNLEDTDGNIIQSTQYGFENNSILYNGEGPLKLRYVSDFTDVPRMDDLFIDILVYEMALGISFKVTGSNTDIQRLEGLAAKRSAMAKAVDGQERPPTRVERSSVIRARKSGYPKRSDRVIWE